MRRKKAQEDRAKVRARAKRYYLAHRTECLRKMSIYARNKRLEKYGLTVLDYEKLFRKQRGCCAICRRRPKKGQRRLAVDHDHKTKKVRGLLCKSCNTALGFLKDSPVLFLAARRYLLRSQSC